MQHIRDDDDFGAYLEPEPLIDFADLQRFEERV